MPTHFYNVSGLFSPSVHSSHPRHCVTGLGASVFGFFVLWFMFMSSLSKSSNCVNICLASCIPSSLSLNRACEAIQSDERECKGRKQMKKALPPTQLSHYRLPTTDLPTYRPTDPLTHETNERTGLYSGLNFAYKRQRFCDCRLCSCTVGQYLKCKNHYLILSSFNASL